MNLKLIMKIEFVGHQQDFLSFMFMQAINSLVIFPSEKLKLPVSRKIKLDQIRINVKFPEL